MTGAVWGGVGPVGDHEPAPRNRTGAGAGCLTLGVGPGQDRHKSPPCRPVIGVGETPSVIGGGPPFGRMLLSFRAPSSGVHYRDLDFGASEKALTASGRPVNRRPAREVVAEGASPLREHDRQPAEVRLDRGHGDAVDVARASVSRTGPFAVTSGIQRPEHHDRPTTTTGPVCLAIVRHTGPVTGLSLPISRCRRHRCRRRPRRWRRPDRKRHRGW